MRFQDIPQMTQAHYSVNVSWLYLKDQIDSWGDRHGNLDLDPIYQRGHVWTRKQQIAYVEYILRGGISGKHIYWNCPGWMDDFRGPMELVDGKQRFTAVMKFLDNKLPIFGNNRLNDFTDELHMFTADFIFSVNNLTSREVLYQWYIDLNQGVAHTKGELEKVQKLLEQVKGG